jgi:mannose-1-phosphate guanylyltransferase
MIVSVNLAGGVGTRLSPLSRKHYPKQLMPVMGGFTIIVGPLR